jgi:hypothetical protein
LPRGKLALPRKSFVRYGVVVPKDIELQISNWDLPAPIEDLLWVQLAKRWSDDDLAKCQWLTGPGFVFIRSLEFDDETIPGIVHYFKLYLTFGGPGELRVYEVHYQPTGVWDEPPPDERDYGGYSEPE